MWHNVEYSMRHIICNIKLFVSEIASYCIFDIYIWKALQTSQDFQKYFTTMNLRKAFYAVCN